MLVEGVEHVGTSRAPSILDSPTLARVERARMRNEGSSTPDRESLLLSRGGAIKRGLLWQQRDRLFSRWKERYFVLTIDYLHCFKRASGGASDMGDFIFKVKLVEVITVEWLNRRSYSAICLELGREGRVLLRATDGLEDWFELLEECTLTSKERRKALRISHEPRSRASLAVPPRMIHSAIPGGSINGALEDWLLARHNTVTNTTSHFPLCDSVPDLSGGCVAGEVTLRRPVGFSGNQEFYRKPQGPLDHRLSLLTDIDLTACDSGLDTPPSTCKDIRPSSYRDVFFMTTPNMMNDSLHRRSEIPYKTTSHNLQGTNSSGSGNTNTGGSSSRGTMLTPGGSFRSSASRHAINGNDSYSPDNKRENEFYNVKNINKNTSHRPRNGTPTCAKTNLSKKANFEDEDDEDDNFYDKFYNYDQECSNRMQRYFNDDRYSNGTAMFKDKYKHPTINALVEPDSSKVLKYRDRSYSDIQQMDKRQWRLRQEELSAPRRENYLVHQPTRV